MTSPGGRGLVRPRVELGGVPRPTECCRGGPWIAPPLTWAAQGPEEAPHTLGPRPNRFTSERACGKSPWSRTQSPTPKHTCKQIFLNTDITHVHFRKCAKAQEHTGKLKPSVVSLIGQINAGDMITRQYFRLSSVHTTPLTQGLLGSHNSA